MLKIILKTVLKAMLKTILAMLKTMPKTILKIMLKPRCPTTQTCHMLRFLGFGVSKQSCDVSEFLLWSV